MSGSYLHTGGSYLPPGIYTGVRIVDITSTRLYETDQGQTNKDEGVGWPPPLLSWLEMSATCRRHVGDTAKCRQILPRKANLILATCRNSSVSAHFCVGISPH